MEEHPVEEQWSSAAGPQLIRQGEPRYDVCVVRVRLLFPRFSRLLKHF